MDINIYFVENNVFLIRILEKYPIFGKHLPKLQKLVRFMNFQEIMEIFYKKIL